MNITRHIMVSVLVLALVSCNSEDGSDVILETSSVLTLNSACQTETLSFKADGAWQAECDADWITLSSTQGYGDSELPIYVQQNDDEAFRQGTIVISDNHSKVTVTVKQNENDNNGSPIINLAKDYGLGWGYDVSEDYADVSGIRGQIFDAAALQNNYGSGAVRADNYTSTNMFFEKAQSSTELQSEIGGKISGGVDIKIAKAKVSVEYSKQINEQKEHLYVWCRDTRTVKMAYFSNDVSATDRDVLKWCTTSSFRNSVKNDNVKDIVRKFGTHLVSTSYLGGKLDYYFTVSQDIKTEIEKVITTINVKILCFDTSASAVDEKTWADIKKDFQGNFVVTGGGETGTALNNQMREYASKGEPLTDPNLFNKWYSCFEDPETAVDSDLAMVDFTVTPLWNIVSRMDAAKGKELKDYILNEYLK